VTTNEGPFGIHNHVKYILADAFQGSRDITVNFTENSNLLKIQDVAFGNPQISSIILPPSYSYSGSALFSGLTRLIRLDLIDSLTEKLFQSVYIIFGLRL
jgi:hypothetical protein